MGLIAWLKNWDISEDQYPRFTDRFSAKTQNSIRFIIWAALIIVAIVLFLKLTGIRIFMDSQNRTHIMSPADPND